MPADLIPLPPGTQVYAVLEMEDERVIDGPLVGLAVTVAAPGPQGGGVDGALVLTLDPNTASPGAQLAWFRVGVDAAFSRDAAERLAVDGPGRPTRG